MPCPIRFLLAPALALLIAQPIGATPPPSASADDPAANASSGDAQAKTRAALIRQHIERARIVMQALSAAAPIKLAWSEYFITHGQRPADMQALALQEPMPAGPATASLTDGVIVLQFDASLDDATLALAAWHRGGEEGVVRWACGKADPPADAELLAGGPPSDYTTLTTLPQECSSK